MPAINEPNLCQLMNVDAQELFVVFSRFEYALKKAGYISGPKDLVKADRRRYILDLDERDQIFNQLMGHELIQIFAANPPRKQFWRENPDAARAKEVYFKPEQHAPAANLLDLVEACARARNNLFHGSKLPFGAENRDQMLVRAASVILRAVVRARPQIHEFFNDFVA